MMSYPARAMIYNIAPLCHLSLPPDVHCWGAVKVSVPPPLPRDPALVTVLRRFEDLEEYSALEWETMLCVVLVLGTDIYTAMMDYFAQECYPFLTWHNVAIEAGLTRVRVPKAWTQVPLRYRWSLPEGGICWGHLSNRSPFVVGSSLSYEIGFLPFEGMVTFYEPGERDRVRGVLTAHGLVVSPSVSFRGKSVSESVHSRQITLVDPKLIHDRSVFGAYYVDDHPAPIGTTMEHLWDGENDPSAYVRFLLSDSTESDPLSICGRFCGCMSCVLRQDSLYFSLGRLSLTYGTSIDPDLDMHSMLLWDHYSDVAECLMEGRGNEGHRLAPPGYTYFFANGNVECERTIWSTQSAFESFAKNKLIEMSEQEVVCRMSIYSKNAEETPWSCKEDSVFWVLVTDYLPTQWKMRGITFTEEESPYGYYNYGFEGVSVRQKWQGSDVEVILFQ